MAEQETDAQRMQRAPGRAFDWVLQELVLPTQAAQVALRDAFIAVANEGHRKAVRAMEHAWPADAHWPSGEAYLRSIGWLSPDEFGDDPDAYDGPELMELLYQRLVHVAHRLYRDVQVRQVLDPSSPCKVKSYTHACVNRHGDFQEDCCNQGTDRVVSIQEALELMAQPAHNHPACRCTVDPFPITSSDRARIATTP